MMNPIRSKHIIIGLVVVFILFIIIRANLDDQPNEKIGTHTTLQSHNSYRSNVSDQSNSFYSVKTQNQSTFNRHDILQTKVKGYRETTYWGSEHPIQEETRYLNDDEFTRFVKEEIEDKDANVYWGAEY